MTVLVDRPLWWHKGERWSHLVSDHSYEELHHFAQAVGLPLKAFQGDHYDVPERMYGEVIERGAKQVDPRVLLNALKAAGLRLSAAERRDNGDANAK